MEKKKIIDSTVIEKFLNGHDEMERIIAIETDFMNPTVSVIYVDSEGNKRIRVEPFKPFVWAKIEVGQKLFGGDRKVLAKELRNHGMWVKQLDTTSVNGENERIENGYKFLFYAVKQMSYNDFINFFRKGGVPLYPKGNEPDTKEFLKVTPTEQFMIATGKRLFKGYNSYGELKRLIFDIETQGLNPSVHAIEQIGVRTNKGLERVISVFGHTEAERKASELNAIREFLKVIHDEKPDIIVGHNSENFDWNFIIERLIVLGSDIETESSVYFEHPIYKKKKETVLKLGGEVEYYFPTIIWGHNVLDSLHASRRAQATDSNMKSSNLKYVTQYLNLKKDNRVYVPGDKITKVWGDTNEHYSFNNTNGEWHEITESRPLGEGCEVVTGKYIVERYLLDDLWETDKIEEKLNETNFLIGKWLPTTFSRAATMGTAGIWKLIMLAWSYENDLAVPALSKNRKFTGGLSRLLEMGYKPRIVKLDFNSLYPATILTWNIKNSVDGSDVLNKFLEYVLTTREVYKGLKKQYGKKAEELKGQLSSFVGTAKERKLIEDEHLHYKAEESLADKKQSQVKVLANSYFGSAGSPGLFPWGDDMAAEMTTCLGRMQLRLMISHFKSLDYQPVVGDTDGFNFQMPETFRYTDEHPYISNGNGRNSKEGKAYTKVEADVAEFEDIYFNHAYNGGINKSGLGIDEYCDACIQFGRKNYADLMPDGSIKKVGNTIKSRKMSGYLEKFIDNGVDLLLHNRGKDFIDSYYDYIEKIYNYQIPIKDIASKGSIKKTLKEYVDDCQKTTKTGAKKSRQAWYELALREGLNLNLGDTIYYINTGVKRSESDCKRITRYFTTDENGKKKNITSAIETLARASNPKKTKMEVGREIYGANFFEEDEIILNCKIVPQEIIEREDDVLCDEYDGLEYNIEKYIDQFNKRVKPLLVCFSKLVRDNILITNPKDRRYFTEKESELVSGIPNKEEDQDTYDVLMTPEPKEIEFWLKVNQVPPFVEECGIPWDILVEEYKEKKKLEDDALFKEEDAKYQKVIESLTKTEIDEFITDLTIPKQLAAIVHLCSDGRFYFNKLPEMTPSGGGYAIDDVPRGYAEYVE